MARIASVLSLLLSSLFFSSAGERIATTSFNFTSFVSSPPEIKFENDAVFTNGSIELNKDTILSQGRAVYSNPVHLWDNKTRNLASFFTRFTFSVIRQPNLTSYADGFAYFLMPVGYPSLPNSIGGGFTLFDRDSTNETAKVPVVAVEFDTFGNIFDPENVGTHLGIDVGYVISAQFLFWDPFKNRTSLTAIAEISYDAEKTNLSASIREDGGIDIGKFLSHVVDLREELPENVSVGFSGSAGLLFEHHSIHSWSFNSSLQIPNIPEDRKNKADGVAAQGPTILTEKKSNVGAVAGGIAAAAALLLATLAWFFVRRLRAGGEMNESDINDEELEEGKGPRRFSYAELALAMRNFSQDQKLGRGGFGTVYKGILSEPAMAVAVKRVAKDSRQGKKEYLSELKIISRVWHRNLVKLLGCCHERGELLLVYEYMPNGSLDGHLFGQTPLLWPARFGIVKGVAAALMYLHEEWEQCVIHRDVKSSNVMLDGDFTAKLGDFGLSRLAEHGGGLETTAVAGTMGYLAPETAMTGRASKESDVYSFVAWEIACGRRPFRERSLSLVEWVWDLYGKGAVVEAADERLGGDFDRGQMERLLMVGLWCAHPRYMDRPTMGQVIGVLTLDMPLPDLPTGLLWHGSGGISFSGTSHTNTRGWSFSASGVSAGLNTGSSADSTGKTASNPLLNPSGR